MSKSLVSQRLGEYIREVERETGRNVSISPFPDATPEDQVRARLILDPSSSDVNIEYRPKRPLTNNTVEKAVAHELTHALLIYAHGYPIACAPDEISDYDVQTAAEIMDFIDDVIVDCMIQERGFPITTPDHLKPIEHNCNALELAKSRDQIDPHIEDPIRAEIKFVGDYIYAWALPRFGEVNNEAKRIFKRYTRRFPQIMKVEFQKAKLIKKLISSNNIFSMEGRTKVVHEAFSLWHLDQRIYLASN